MSSIELPVGVLIVRLWTEEGDPRLRARVSRTTDVVGLRPTTLVTADRDEVVRAVVAFLDDFIRDAEGARRPP